jgi:hypothetical protein
LLLLAFGASPDDAGIADPLALPDFDASADIPDEPEAFALSVVVFFLLLFLLLLVFFDAC